MGEGFTKRVAAALLGALSATATVAGAGQETRAQAVQRLSPETRAFLGHIEADHPDRSAQATLRQVMQGLLADYQAVAAALAVDDGEAAARAARRLAGHRMPAGGMLGYLPLEKINDADLAALPAMEEAVEGNAKRLAAAAQAGDIARAAGFVGEIMGGCVGCHQRFRGVPGALPRR